MDAQNRKVPQRMLPTGFAGKITLRIMNKMHGAIYTNTASVLRLSVDDDVLDVGCGNGYFLDKYAAHVRSVDGLDLSEVSIEMARRRHRKRIEAGTAEFVRGEASQLPWEDNTFSAVTSMGSFTSFPKPLQVLQEMWRALRPSGRAVLSIEWNAEDGQDHSKETEKYGTWIWTEDDVRDMMARANFTQVSIEYRKAMALPKMMLASGVKP
jgi:ubiquinone/menaquinone biosynthesis C-methylase UbiE